MSTYLAFRQILCRKKNKKLIYEIDISLDKNGEIMECQCDCRDGIGPSAHCKHVFCWCPFIATFIVAIWYRTIYIWHFYT